MSVEQIQLSSPGLTGRPSTPRLLGSIERSLGYWIPAFAGMTSYGWDDGLGLRHARILKPC
ncbi:hypothetical protein V1289_002276 [Bradyrhizobium sp. AZCC 2289]